MGISYPHAVGSSFCGRVVLQEKSAKLMLHISFVVANLRPHQDVGSMIFNGVLVVRTQETTNKWPDPDWKERARSDAIQAYQKNLVTTNRSAKMDGTLRERVDLGSGSNLDIELSVAGAIEPEIMLRFQIGSAGKSSLWRDILRSPRAEVIT